MISQSNNTTTSNPVIAVIGIELGQGESTDLEIHLHDCPSELAKLFCKQKGLSSELEKYIEENIRVDQDIAMKELQSQQQLQKEIVQVRGGQEMFEKQNNQNGLSNSRQQGNSYNNVSNSNGTFMNNNNDKTKQHELSFQQDNQIYMKTQLSDTTLGSSVNEFIRVIKTEHSDITNQSNNNYNNSNIGNINTNKSIPQQQGIQQQHNSTISQNNLIHSSNSSININAQFLEMNKKILMEKQSARSILNSNNNTQQKMKNTNTITNNTNDIQSIPGLNSTNRQQNTQEQQENIFQINHSTPSWLNDLKQFEWYAQLTASQPQRTSISKKTKQHHNNNLHSSQQIIHPSNQSHTSSGMLTSARQLESQHSISSQYIGGSSYRSKRSNSLNQTRSERNNEQIYKNKELTFKPQINEISDIIAKGSAAIQDPFKRLYENALTKKKEKQDDRYDQETTTVSKKKRVMSSYNNSCNTYTDELQPKDSITESHQNNSNLKAAGVQASQRLYADRQKLEFKRQEAFEKHQYEKMEKHIIECTHHPQLNSTSKIIANLRRNGQNSNNLPVEEQLLRESQAKAIKISQLKAERINQELQQCTFKPIINEVSNVLDIVKMSNENNSSNNTASQAIKVPRFEQLFYQAKVKQQKQTTQPSSEEISDTFRPQINSSSRNIKSSFTQRQQLLQVSKIQRHSILARQAEEKDRRDAVTGREFFHPLTGRAPINETHPDESISDYLFKLSTERKTESEFKQLLQMKYRQDQSQPQINQYSRDLNNQVEESIIDQMFEGLDNDKDGLISAKLISIDSIPPMVLEAISPVLFEMEEHELILNRIEFKLAIQTLINKSPITVRQSIIAGYKKKPRSYSLRA